MAKRELIVFEQEHLSGGDAGSGRWVWSVTDGPPETATVAIVAVLLHHGRGTKPEPIDLGSGRVLTGTLMVDAHHLCEPDEGYGDCCFLGNRPCQTSTLGAIPLGKGWGDCWNDGMYPVASGVAKLLSFDQLAQSTEFYAELKVACIAHSLLADFEG